MTSSMFAHSPFFPIAIGFFGLGTGYLIAVIGAYLLILLITLALWIWYVVILHQTRGSISRRLAS